MAVCIASDLAKDMAGQPLFRGVSLRLERGERLTLAGRNGAGKTTLLRMLAGETSIDGGELVLAKDVKVSLHDQRPPRETGVSLRDYVLTGCAELLALEARLAELEQRMAEGDVEESIFDAYARAQARLEHAGGYTWREGVNATLRGLGFSDGDLDRDLATFSGGEVTRASLARALAGDPDLLLLDEPTNHLDIESLEWLEQHLVGLDAAVVLVAHDRWFLEAVGTAVLELEGGRGRFFKGTWHTWRQEKAQRELALERTIARQEEEIARLERFVTRFRAGTRARQAQSRQKRLDRIDRAERDPRDGKALGFQFKPPERTGRVIFEIEGGRVTIGDRVLLDGAEFWLERGEHVSLVGMNGSGKTTLLKVLAGEHELAAGKLRKGHNLKVGFLSQHEDFGPQGGSVLEACQRATSLKPNEARALLGRFLFSGEAAEKPLDGLSGGERKRLSLACLVSGGSNVLVLDEPTNHLDLESREALEAALQEFPGSVLLVSHDRALLDAVGTRTVAVEEGTLRSYVGGWPEYVRVRAEREESERAAKRAKPKAERSAPRPAAAPAPSKNARRQAERLEQRIAEAEAALAALEEELAAPDAWSTPERSARNSERHAAARRAVEELYAQYEAVS